MKNAGTKPITADLWNNEAGEVKVYPISKAFE